MFPKHVFISTVEWLQAYSPSLWPLTALCRPGPHLLHSSCLPGWNDSVAYAQPGGPGALQDREAEFGWVEPREGIGTENAGLRCQPFSAGSDASKLTEEGEGDQGFTWTLGHALTWRVWLEDWRCQPLSPRFPWAAPGGGHWGLAPLDRFPVASQGDRYALDLKPELSKGTLCRGSPPPPSTVQGRQRWGTEWCSPKTDTC